jgi:hypothetical protein
MSTIREAVAQEIRRQGKTQYAFARDFGNGVHPVTILKWLYSGKKVSVEMADRALAVLDLVIVPRSSLGAQPKPVKRVRKSAKRSAGGWR